jgi:hypothetical protein
MIQILIPLLVAVLPFFLSSMAESFSRLKRHHRKRQHRKKQTRKKQARKKRERPRNRSRRTRLLFWKE